MPRALIINPNEGSRITARLVLESLGFEVMHANDGAEALACLLRSQPDMVLLDGAAEESDPFALITTITAFSAATRPFLIFTTPKAAAMTVNEALEAGADDYLIGTFTRELLGFKLAQASSRGLIRSALPVINHLRKAI